TAGTGDVLSGVVAAFLAQGLDGPEAAAAAAFVHATAGHLGWRRGLVAGDLIDLLPAALSRLDPEHRPQRTEDQRHRDQRHPKISPRRPMPRSTPVRQLMTTDVVTFRPDDTVESAARVLTERRLGGGPVVDAEGHVLGLLEDDDLIVQDAKLHFPTVITVLGAYIELPSSQRHFEED